jgi:hypothetical protein
MVTRDLERHKEIAYFLSTPLTALKSERSDDYHFPIIFNLDASFGGGFSLKRSKIDRMTFPDVSGNITW